MSRIVLQCVKEKSKLRIRFHTFTDTEGKTYTNVYDNSLNCMFPKDIRQEGLFYEIKEDSLEFVARNGAKPFYRVNGRIRILTPEETPTSSNGTATLDGVTIYEIQECVVCMCEDSSEVLVPCGHKCMCNGCAMQIFKTTRKCPICRKHMNSMLNQSA